MCQPKNTLFSSQQGQKTSDSGDQKIILSRLLYPVRAAPNLLTRYPFLPNNYKSYCALAMDLKYKLFMMDLKWILEKLSIKNGKRMGHIFNGRWKGLDVCIISGWQGWKFPWSSNTLRLIILCMIMRISLSLLNLCERKWLWSATWLISPKREAL